MRTSFFASARARLDFRSFVAIKLLLVVWAPHRASTFYGTFIKEPIATTAYKLLPSPSSSCRCYYCCCCCWVESIFRLIRVGKRLKPPGKGPGSVLLALWALNLLLLSPSLSISRFRFLRWGIANLIPSFISREAPATLQPCSEVLGDVSLSGAARCFFIEKFRMAGDERFFSGYVDAVLSLSLIAYAVVSMCQSTSFLLDFWLLTVNFVLLVPLLS